MTERKNINIITIVGMPGAGKSLATEIFAEKGLPTVHANAYILHTLEKRGIVATLENEKIIREELRNSASGDMVVRDVIEQINGLIGAGQHTIIVDGIGSWLGYKDLRRAFPGCVTTIAILASRHIRHHRLEKNEHRPMTATEATERDYDEIETLGKGGVIALAEKFIINEEPLDMFKTRVQMLVDELTD